MRDVDAELETYRSKRLAERRAQIVAEFEHPVTGAPMVTWWQFAPLLNEEGEFYSASKKEFLSWFEPKAEPGS